MKALVHEKIAGIDGLAYRDFEEAQPGAGEVRVKLKTAGMNHRDLFVLHRHKPTDSPLVIGSDGAGVIDAIGEGVSNVNIGDEVIINPSLGWKDEKEAPPEGFEILGLPFHGTFAEKINVPAENIYAKPAHLTWEEAGVMPLAALTAYRALFSRGQVKAGMNVLIPGIGGGVATFLLQFAKAAGAKVYVTSRSAEKREAALKLGAEAAIDSSSSDWSRSLDGVKMDLVIESVGAATFNQSLQQLRKGGTVVTFGTSTGDEVTVNIREIFYGQFNILGTTMGNAEEFQQMLHFMNEHKIKPVMDKMYPLSQFKDAFERLDAAKQLGKIGFYTE